MASLSVLGSIAYDNLFLAQNVPLLGQRAFGRRLGKHVGGMAANQALEAARYMEGVQIIGKVGGDVEGRNILVQLAEKNVGTELLMVDESKATGQTYMFLVDDDYFSIVAPEANQHIHPEEAIKAVDQIGSGFLLVSLEINLDAVSAALRRARTHGIETILIPSPVEKCSQEILRAADSIILNRREARELLGMGAGSREELVDELSKAAVEHKRMAVTLGSEGAVLWQDKEVYRGDALPVDAVDVVGAGDAFSGALVAWLAMEMPPQKAISLACIAGGLAVSHIGAQSSAHTMGTVMALHNKYYSNQG